MTLPSQCTVAPLVIGILAEAFRSAGVRLATNHPGFHSQSLAVAVAGPGALTSTNERTAFAVAWGAAAGGCRSLVALKNVGLNDAADAFLNAMTLDLTAALVVVVFDDTDVEQSQLRLDSRHYHAFLGGIWLEPASLTEAGRMARQAVALSERFSSPVVVRITNRMAAITEHAEETSEPPGSSAALPPPPVFYRNPSAFVVHPARHHAAGAARLTQKRRAWESWATELWRKSLGPWQPDKDGILHLVAGSAPPPDGVGRAAIARLPMLPVPAKAILESVARPHAIVVHEHGDPIVATALAAARPGLPEVRPVCGGTENPNRRFHNRTDLTDLFAQLRALPKPLVVGDVGGHTMDPQHSIDACLCYGASVAVAMGLATAMPDHSVSCVIGDGAWLHGGKQALAEAVARSVRLLVVVLNNGGCQSTGGQLPPGDLTTGIPGIIEVFEEMPLRSTFINQTDLLKLAARPGIKVIYLKLPN